MNVTFLFTTTLLAGTALSTGRASCPDGGHCQFPKLAPQALVAGDNFGSAVAASPDFVFIGAPDANAVYVLERGAGSIDPVQTLVPPAKAAIDFGAAVAVDGEWLIVGAPGDDSQGTDAGAVYFFRFEAKGGWTYVQQGTAANAQPFDRLGRSVAISGLNAVVGADGKPAAYVFRYIQVLFSMMWTSVEIAAPAAAGDFGYAVAIHGDDLAVGAWGDDNPGTNAGAVYVYRWNGIGFVPHQTLTAADLGPFEPQALDFFGSALAMNGADLVVGAYGRDDGGANAGAAYVYRRTLHPFPEPSTWEINTKLTACDAQSADNFGVAVGIDPTGGFLVVGARYEDQDGSDAGAAYVFRRTPSGASTWTAEDRLKACDAQSGDEFGIAVAIAGDHAVVGADRDDDQGTDAGAAYVFSLAKSTSGGSCLCPCDGPATSFTYGSAKPGSVGTPGIAETAPAVLGEVSGIRVTNGLPGAAPVILFLGPTSANLPFDDGALLVGSSISLVLPPFPASGTLTLEGTLPVLPGLCGTTLHHQVMFADPGATGLYHTAQTAGLARVFGS